MLGGVGSMNLKYNVKIFVGAARAGEAAPYLFKVGNEQKSLRSFRVT